MSNLREAAQQALDALAGYRREMNLIRGESYMHGQPCDAEIALRAALEQAEPKRHFVTGDEFLVTGNEFYGAPPAPYANWGEAMATMLDAGVIEGLRIYALEQQQDPELSAALGWPGGISDPVLDRETLLQQVARLVERAHGIGEEE